MVLARVEGGGCSGIGYSYTSRAAAGLIRDVLAPVVAGCGAMDIGGCWERMRASVRNINHAGLVAMAISAVDIALWDLKSRLLGIALVDLLGAVRASVPIYGSGGFTSYTVGQLQQQLAGWVEEGIPRVKMKVGTDPSADPGRVRAAREAIGPDAMLFVDANGAYSRKQALTFAERFADLGVSWFEEPVATQDLAGMRLMRDRAPAAMDIAGGEYAFDAEYFRRMLEAQAVDVLQADATRCGGITGMMRAGALCEVFHVPLSAHTAPSLHAHVCCTLAPARHVEYFHDHARIERMLFDGFLEPVAGALAPDLSRSGLGLEFKHTDAAKYEVRIA